MRRRESSCASVLEAAILRGRAVQRLSGPRRVSAPARSLMGSSLRITDRALRRPLIRGPSKGTSESPLAMNRRPWQCGRMSRPTRSLPRSPRLSTICLPRSAAMMSRTRKRLDRVGLGSRHRWGHAFAGAAETPGPAEVLERRTWARRRRDARSALGLVTVGEWRRVRRWPLLPAQR